jgi:hypothetical protein
MPRLRAGAVTHRDDDAVARPHNLTQRRHTDRAAQRLTQQSARVGGGGLMSRFDNVDVGPVRQVDAQPAVAVGHGYPQRPHPLGLTIGIRRRAGQLYREFQIREP